jgi:hypothetical protein
MDMSPTVTKKVVGVFVRFSCAASKKNLEFELFTTHLDVGKLVKSEYCSQCIGGLAQLAGNALQEVNGSTRYSPQQKSSLTY